MFYHSDTKIKKKLAAKIINKLPGLPKILEKLFEANLHYYVQTNLKLSGIDKRKKNRKMRFLERTIVKIMILMSRRPKPIIRHKITSKSPKIDALKRKCKELRIWKYDKGQKVFFSVKIKSD